MPEKRQKKMLDRLIFLLSLLFVYDACTINVYSQHKSKDVEPSVVILTSQPGELCARLEN